MEISEGLFVVVALVVVVAPLMLAGTLVGHLRRRWRRRGGTDTSRPSRWANIWLLLWGGLTLVGLALFVASYNRFSDGQEAARQVNVKANAFAIRIAVTRYAGTHPLAPVPASMSDLAASPDGVGQHLADLSNPVDGASGAGHAWMEYDGPRPPTAGLRPGTVYVKLVPPMQYVIYAADGKGALLQEKGDTFCLTNR